MSTRPQRTLFIGDILWVENGVGKSALFCVHYLGAHVATITIARNVCLEFVRLFPCLCRGSSLSRLLLLFICIFGTHYTPRLTLRYASIVSVCSDHLFTRTSPWNVDETRAVGFFFQFPSERGGKIDAAHWVAPSKLRRVSDARIDQIHVRVYSYYHYWLLKSSL